MNPGCTIQRPLTWSDWQSVDVTLTSPCGTLFSLNTLVLERRSSGPCLLSILKIKMSLLLTMSSSLVRTLFFSFFYLLHLTRFSTMSFFRWCTAGASSGYSWSHSSPGVLPWRKWALVWNWDIWTIPWPFCSKYSCWYEQGNNLLDIYLPLSFFKVEPTNCQLVFPVYFRFQSTREEEPSSQN